MLNEQELLDVMRPLLSYFLFDIHYFYSALNIRSFTLIRGCLCFKQCVKFIVVLIY